MDFEEFIKQTLSSGAPTREQKKKKSAEEITAEFMPLVEADRRRGG